MAVLSSVSQGPKFVLDPVLKAARERQTFLNSKELANPSFKEADGFIGVVGAKSLGVALDPETGRMPQTSDEVFKELAGDAEPREFESAELPRRADLDRIAELEQKLMELNTEQEREVERVRAQAFSEGQAQGQLEAKQMLEMESESSNAALVSELGDIVGELVNEARNHLVAHQDLFDPLKKLALALAEQIARRELTLSDASLTGFIEESLSQVDPMQMGEVIIYVSHDWYERLQQPELEAIFATYALRRDDALQPGSVRLAVEDTSIVDLIDHRVEQLADQLLTDVPTENHESKSALQMGAQAQSLDSGEAGASEVIPTVEEPDYFAGELDDQGAIIQGDYSEVEDIFFQRPPDEDEC